MLADPDMMRLDFVGPQAVGAMFPEVFQAPDMGQFALFDELRFTCGRGAR